MDNTCEYLTDYELLNRFNPFYIDAHIKEAKNAIESMYDAQTPSLCVDSVTSAVYYQVQGVEPLAIRIIELREALERYTAKAERAQAILIRTLQRYTPHEQYDVMRFFFSGGAIRPPVMNRLAIDLYKSYTLPRIKRIEAQEKQEADRKRIERKNARKRRNKANGGIHKETIERIRAKFITD